MKGIEPSQSAWKAGALPLSYTRMLNTLNFYWSGRRDSNPRPSPWQGDALPLSHFRVVVRLEGLEPPRTGRQILSLVRLPIPPQPHFNMEATSRFELEMKELQSSALPLGYVAILLIF